MRSLLLHSASMAAGILHNGKGRRRGVQRLSNKSRTHMKPKSVMI